MLKGVFILFFLIATRTATHYQGLFPVKFRGGFFPSERSDATWKEKESAALSFDEFKDKVYRHFQSFSEDISTLNKDLLNITDTFAMSVKNVTNDIATRASANVLDGIEQVWQRFNETISTLSFSRPTVVLHFVDSDKVTLSLMKEMLAAQRQLANNGISYHILYFERESALKSNDLMMFEGLFTKESFTVIQERDFHYFLNSIFSPKGYSFPSRWKDKWHMDYLVLYWLARKRLLDIPLAKHHNIGSSCSLFAVIPHFLWLLDSELHWQGDISRLLSALVSDDLFYSSDYAVLPIMNANSTVNFGVFDKSCIGTEITQFVQNILRSIVKIGALSSSSLDIAKEGNFTKDFPAIPFNISEDSLSATLSLLESSLPRRPLLSRYSMSFFRKLSLESDSSDSLISEPSFTNYDVRKPLVAHFLQRFHRQLKNDALSSRLICSDLSEVMIRKGLWRNSNPLTSAEASSLSSGTKASTVSVPLFSSIFGDESSESFFKTTDRLTLPPLTLDPQANYFYSST